MNLNPIRQQLAEIKVEEMDLTNCVKEKIKSRQKKRQQSRRAGLVLACLLLCSLVMASQSKVLARTLTRSISIFNKDDTILIPDLTSLPFQPADFDWSVGKKGQRVLVKSYPDLKAVQAETGFWPLENPLSLDLARHRNLTLVYHEAKNLAQLNLERHFIGDLKNYQENESTSEELSYSYETAKDNLYLSPLHMSMSFLSGSGQDLTVFDWEFYNYKEKYTSPVNGLVAYLLNDNSQIGLGSEKMALAVAAGQADKAVVFVYDNILYSISGQVKDIELKRLVDAFVLKN